MTANLTPVNPPVNTDALPIELRGWGWRHPGRKRWALQDVNLRLEAAQTILVVGNSGAGKSTLLHGIAGILDSDEGDQVGTVTVAGMPASAPEVRGLVGLVQQDPESQRVMGRIGDEVAFGLENLGVPREKIWPQVERALSLVGLNRYPLDHSTANLSGGEKQRLALACALAMRPRVILLDEPTANLDAVGAREVRAAAQNLSRSTGATLIVVEHNLGPWLDGADRMLVLTDGRVAQDGEPHQILSDHRDVLREAGVWIPGLDPLAFTPPRSAPSQETPPDLALQTEKLAVGYEDGPQVLDSLDLRFARATSTCITGQNGAGKTTLALTLAGLLEARAGEVVATPNPRGAAPERRAAEASAPDPDLKGNPYSWSPPELLGRISMVFQEPQYQFLTSSVEEELALGPRQAGVAEPEVEARTERYLSALRLQHLRAAHPLSLSGGERRRLGVGAALIAAPEILILDEPTFGQDFNTWVELVTLLCEAAVSGTTLVIVTHDPNLVRALGDRVTTVEAGEQPDAREHRAPATEETGLRKKAGRHRSPLSRVNPVFQILGLLLMTLPLLVSIDPVSAAVAAALDFALLPLARLRPRQVLIRLSPLLIAAPLAAISMLLYAKPGGAIYAQWGPVTISENSVLMAVSLALRVLAVGMPAVIILPSLGSTETADALTQVAHLPARLVLSSLAAIRMVGLMLSDWRALARARRSRGMKGSNFARTGFSLVTFALRRADHLSVSMEARGFGAPIPRTNARESKLSRADALMILVSALVPTIALGAAALTGTLTWFGIG